MGRQRERHIGLPVIRKTTMAVAREARLVEVIYAHVLNVGGKGIRSPCRPAIY
ncbi:MAG: hypothetical protein PHY02_03830 [Phycisphaerae bacterium]|nr:hypothetical protein [Phycisphaerae bacterium]